MTENKPNRNPAKKAPLTKRALVRAINKGTKGLGEKEMRLLGYITRLENGNVVRIDKDGNKTIIAKVEHDPRSKKIILD